MFQMFLTTAAENIKNATTIQSILMGLGSTFIAFGAIYWKTSKLWGLVILGVGLFMNVLPVLSSWILPVPKPDTISAPLTISGKWTIYDSSGYGYSLEIMSPGISDLDGSLVMRSCPNEHGTCFPASFRASGKYDRATGQLIFERSGAGAPLQKYNVTFHNAEMASGEMTMDNVPRKTYYFIVSRNLN